jgi:myosin-5
MGTNAAYAEGQHLFCQSDEGYTPVVVTACRGFGESLKVDARPLAGGSARTLSADECASLLEADPMALQGAPDMVRFSHLSEAALLHNLRVRYQKDDIYTRAGSILISVNPFKPLGIYTAEQMKLTNVRAAAPAATPSPHRTDPPSEPKSRRPHSPAPEAVPTLSPAQDADAKELQELPPHVYVLAEAAFRGMLVEQKQQAVLISGESGAGKTEAVKACLRYIVSRSSAAARDHGESASPARGGAAGGAAPAGRARFIEDCILQANLLLEALGNAKTVRNGNSSRFGKWVEVQFDASGFITASRITSYLLEKSRVAEHAQGERTYHILYQLCRGAPPEQQRELQLLPLPDFRYAISTSPSDLVIRRGWT